jgi:hypothetical protein
MNHKRRRPKSQRSGCLMCKYYKGNHSKMAERMTMSTRRRLASAESTQEHEAQR